MKKLFSVGLACILSVAGLGAYAQDAMQKHDSMKDGTAMKEVMPMKDGMGMKRDMKMMDRNGDGMVSKKEFMKFHEAMWDQMKKDHKGMVSIKDIEAMHGGMMMKK